jgi:glycosyltransferase involved in cell wall biosynthesis
MYHANFMGALMPRRKPRPPLIWGVRQTDLDPRHSKRRTILVAHAGARLSTHIPDHIVCVSGSARDVHVALGYDSTKMSVIPNGFDLEVFRPDPAARQYIRAELGVEPEGKVIGLAARVDPQKDHRTFFAAAKIIAKRWPEAVFVLCGEGAVESNEALAATVRSAGLGSRIRLLGYRSDIQRVTAAFDVAVSSSSFGEGFSNTLGEALCCGVPVVATDVSEARALIGDAGRVVPRGDPDAMAAAISELFALAPGERQRLGEIGRRRMARDYGLDNIAERYRALYNAVLAAGT